MMEHSRLDANLKKQAMNASLWRLLQSLCGQGVNFVVQVVLARLLLPRDFGLIAMVWVLVALTETFINSGYGAALIQKQRATYVDECSVFYFNIGVSIIGYVLLWLLAPYVARFYDQPLLTSLTRVVSLILLVGAFGNVQLSLLGKRIDFKTQCRIDITASIASGVVGVAMALLGFGVWSLVAQYLSRMAARVGLAWYYSEWRPAWLFSFRSLRSMFMFGSNVLLTELLETMYQNVYAAVIGKFYSPVELGLYSRASRLQELPAKNMTFVVTGVAFPVFSKVQGDRVRLRNGLRTCVGLLALSVFPVMIALAAVAKPFVLILLTNKWLPCVPYLQMLCIVGAMYPFYTLQSKVLLATGRPRLFFWVHLFQKMVAVLTIAITYRWGIMGLVSGQVVASVLSTVLISLISGKVVGYPLMSQIVETFPYLVLSVAIGIALHGIGFIPFQSDTWLLVAQTVAGVAVFFSFCGLFRPRAFIFLRNFASEALHSRRVEKPLSV